MLKFLFKALVNSSAIYLAGNLVEGFTFSGDFVILAGIGLALAIFQLFIYPIIKIVAFPLVFVSFGFFSFFVNMLALLVLSYYIPHLTIEGIIPLILGTTILSMVNLLFSWL
ncbi:MAG: phage holin family protein [Candidatus Spechtbacterales bacterium]